MKENTRENNGNVLFEARKYRLIGTTPMLGTQLANEAIRTQYLASKAPKEDLSEEEKELFARETREQSGHTVFPRDPDADSRIILLDYMVRGFLKSALLALTAQEEIAAAKSKVDKYLFVFPRRIQILRDGEAIYDEDYIFERTLRAETMQGPRVVLAASETIDAPWEIEIEMRLLKNAGSKRSKALTWEAVENALSYGEYCGIGQFRNGSFGRFYWERMDG